jgi:hypothetical protein
MSAVLLVTLFATVAFAFQPGMLPRHTPATATAPVVMRLGRWRPGKDQGIPDDVVATEEEVIVPEAASEAVSVDVAEAAEAIKESMVQLPKIDIDAEAAEDFAINAFKATKGAVDSVVEFSKENDVATKVVDAAKGMQEFEKENELMIKAQAIFQLGFEAISDAVASQKSLKPKAKMTKPKAGKVPKQWQRPSAKKGKSPVAKKYKK